MSDNINPEQYKIDLENYILNLKKTFYASPEKIKEYEEELKRREFREYQILKNENRVNGSVPERYISADFSTMQVMDEEQGRIKKYLQSYCESRINRNLLIHGPRGTGKTYMVCAMIAERGGVYCTASDIFRQLRSSFNKKGGDEIKIINNFRNVKFLVIDEIGRQSGSIYEDVSLFDIIDGRYSKRVPTVLVTNLEPGEDLTRFVGAAAMDRINENAAYINCSWQSWRDKIRKESH